MHVTVAWALAAVIASGDAPSAKQPNVFKAQVEITTPADVVKTMEKSKVRYVLHPLSDLKEPSELFALKLWRPAGKATEHPFVRVDASGHRALIPFPATEDAVRELAAADDFFSEGQRELAHSRYLDLANRFPDYYRVHLSLGVSHEFWKKDHPAALAEFEQAMRQNPYDYSGFLLAGGVLRRLGRNDEAVEADVHALSLSAYNSTILDMSEAKAAQLGVTPHAERFKPNAFVRRGKGSVAIYVDGGAHWLAWASCKAVWIAEPGYREKRTGTPSEMWSSQEDVECMAHLLEVYSDLRASGSTPAEPQLERLRSLIDDRLLTEFVLYEFGSRIAPDSLVLVSGQPDLRMEEFIRRYVLIKTPEVPTPAAP